MKKAIIFLIVAIATVIATLTAHAEDATFETITEALNYTGDREAVTKLIITGTIAGDDYSDGSEWREFRTLNETFPNIEAVEILTDQDIPNNDNLQATMNSLFYYENEGERNPTMWLKSFSAPNVKKIGAGAFFRCWNLSNVYFPSAITIGAGAFFECVNFLSVYFPSVTTIGGMAFFYCSFLSVYFPSVTTIGEWAFYACLYLISIDFPSVTAIGDHAFAFCYTISTVSFGTELKEPTEIVFGRGAFGGGQFPHLSPNIALTLGEYVLPEPDLEAMTWQTAEEDGTGSPYVWKTITKHTNITEPALTTHFTILPNPTNADAVVNFGLLESNEVILEVSDLIGNVLYTITNFYDAGEHYVPIDVKKFVSGSYLCRMLAKGKQIGTINFVVGK